MAHWFSGRSGDGGEAWRVERSGRPWRCERWAVGCRCRNGEQAIGRTAEQKHDATFDGRRLPSSIPRWMKKARDAVAGFGSSQWFCREKVCQVVAFCWRSGTFFIRLSQCEGPGRRWEGGLATRLPRGRTTASGVRGKDLSARLLNGRTTAGSGENWPVVPEVTYSDGVAKHSPSSKGSRRSHVTAP